MAALLVLIAHVQSELVINGGSSDLNNQFIVNAGQFGVDIFFVLSGFIITYITASADKGVSAPLKFWLKRVIRVAPLYWLMTGATVAVSLAAGSLKNHNDLRWTYILKSLLFIPATRLDGSLAPPINVGWTLNYEMLFYVLFGAALLAPRKYTLVVIGTALCVLAAAGAFLARPASVWFWTRPIILEFLLGAVIAQAMVLGRRPSARAGLALLAAGLAGWLLASVALVNPAQPEIRVLTSGLPAAAVVAGLALPHRSILHALPAQAAKAVGHVGTISYSLYLSHGFVVRLVAIAMPWLHSTGLTIALFCLTSMAASLLAAHLSYRYLETHLNRLGERLTLGGRTPRIQDATMQSVAAQAVGAGAAPR